MIKLHDRSLLLAGMFLSAFLGFLLPCPAMAHAQASEPTATPGTPDNPMQLSMPRTVTIVVADLDKEVEWYKTVLGFKVNPKFGGGTPNPNATDRVKRIELVGFRLDLVWHKGSTRPVPPEHYQEGIDHFSFETTAMDEDYKWLTAHGVTIDAVRDKKTNALKIMRFHDPEGNEIHVETPN
jgi:catechol 2,3-dioxygenase-like lactoylglutathione lyase family enzyme